MSTEAVEFIALISWIGLSAAALGILIVARAKRVLEDRVLFRDNKDDLDGADEAKLKAWENQTGEEWE
jgi:hypothetical protein